MLVQAPPAPHRVLTRDVTIISPERKAPLQQGYVVLENGSDILMDGGVTAAYWYGELAPK